MKPARTQPTRSPLRLILVALLVLGLAFAFLWGLGLQTYLNQERRLVAAGNEIVTALAAYRAASPGTAKELPLNLNDLMHDPRMLADKGYLTALPVDPVAQRQEWGMIKNQAGQIVGVHSLSNAAPTWIGKLLSLQSGATYKDWRFTVSE